MQEKKHQRFIDLMNLIGSNLPSERELAEVLGVTNTDIRRWKTGVGRPDFEVFEAAAIALGWSMDRVVAFLNDRKPRRSLSARQVVAEMKLMPLTEVALVVEAGVTRLSGAAQRGVLQMNELNTLIAAEMARQGLDEVEYARRVRLSVGVLRQIKSGLIPGNPKTKLGNLAANLTNPNTNRPFLDWEELALFCGLGVENIGEVGEESGSQRCLNGHYDENS